MVLKKQDKKNLERIGLETPIHKQLPEQIESCLGGVKNVSLESNVLNLSSLEEKLQQGFDIIFLLFNGMKQDQILLEEGSLNGSQKHISQLKEVLTKSHNNPPSLLIVVNYAPNWELKKMF